MPITSQRHRRQPSQSIIVLWAQPRFAASSPGKARLVVRISAVDTPRQIRGHWRNRPEPNRLNFARLAMKWMPNNHRILRTARVRRAENSRIAAIAGTGTPLCGEKSNRLLTWPLRALPGQINKSDVSPLPRKNCVYANYSLACGELLFLSSCLSLRSVAPIKSASNPMIDIAITLPKNRMASSGENLLSLSTQSVAPATSAMKKVAANISQVVNRMPAFYRPRSKNPYSLCPLGRSGINAKSIPGRHGAAKLCAGPGLFSVAPLWHSRCRLQNVATSERENNAVSNSSAARQSASISG